MRLTREERELLRSLPAQLLDLLRAGDEPSLRRLRQPAYADDPEREEEYRSMVRADLDDGRRRALETLEATVDADRLGEEELAAWLASLNNLRLVLGTSLDVTEDPEVRVDADDPRAAQLSLYLYLGWLEEQVVEALAAELPS